MKKNNLMKTLISSAFAVFITLVACSSDPKTKQDVDQVKVESIQTVQVVQPGFSDLKVKQIYSSYIHLKDALFNSNVTQVKSTALNLQKALTAVGNSKGADLSNRIANASSLEIQRSSLTAISAEVEKVIKEAKLSSGIIYKQFCPMANGGKGGYWLASESTIKNPYYGDQMSSCGSVKEEIK